MIRTADPPPRWHHRFDNFARAVNLLREAVAVLNERPLSVLEREGLVQRFAYTWELAWKVLSDFLQAEGVVLETVTPRAVLRAALAAGTISDGETWMAALDDRNRMAHIYSVKAFDRAVEAIAMRYLSVLDALHATLAARRADGD